MPKENEAIWEIRKFIPWKNAWVYLGAGYRQSVSKDKEYLENYCTELNSKSVFLHRVFRFSLEMYKKAGSNAEPK